MNESTFTSTGTLVLGGGQRRWIALTVLLIPAALTLRCIAARSGRGRSALWARCTARRVRSGRCSAGC